MASLLVAALLLVVTTLIVNAILSVAAERRVLGKTSGTEPGDATGAVLMASDYGGPWHSPDQGGSTDVGSWSASDCGSGMDAAGGGGDCGGGGGDGGGGGGGGD